MSPFDAYEYAMTRVAEQQAVAERRRRLRSARAGSPSRVTGFLRGRRRGAEDTGGCRA